MLRKKIAVIALVIVMMPFTTGCSGQQQDRQGQQSGPGDNSVTHTYNLSKEVSFQGVSIKIDPSWVIKAPKECDFYVHVDDKNNHLSIKTVMHGQIINIESAWKEFFASNDNPDKIDEWSDKDVDYFSGIFRKGNANYWLFTGSEKSSGKGFLVSFTCSKKDWSESDQKQVFTDVTDTLAFDPSKLTIDYHEWWEANENNSHSSPDANNSEPPKLDQSTPEPPTPTVSQQNALKKAKSYINSMAFSYTGLIKQLEYNKFSTEDATYGADNCGADWNEQAAKKAADYLKYSSFSRGGLIDQLVYNGFTQDQATYGADSVGL